MAVKKHGLVPDNNVPNDLGMLAYYLDTSKVYLLSPSELIKWCKTIVILLSKIPIPKEPNDQVLFYIQVQQVQDYLKKMMNDIEQTSRVNLLFSLLKQLYIIISKATPQTCPAISIVLSLLDSPIRNVAVRLFLRQGGAVATDEGSSNGNTSEKECCLRMALITLCRWLCYWEGTPTLHQWIISFMKALQESNKFDILIDVSMVVVNDLFDALQNPSVRTVVINVFMHILASTRDSLETFHKISHQVPTVLESLASDTSPESRSVLQNLVEAFTALLDAHPIEKKQYIEIVNCLDSHIKSKGYIMDVPIWKRSLSPMEMSPSRRSSSKVGLLNLGNTCYMNSALQALFMTKIFSNGVVLSPYNFPLLCKLKSLFAHMMFSDIPYLNPQEIFNFSKPVNFPRGTQQDTSEFICHLLDRLHEIESFTVSIKGNTTTNDETTKPLPAIEGPPDEAEPNCSTADDPELSEEERAGLKRSSESMDHTLEKRRCLQLLNFGDTNQTIVQKVFAGTINTSTCCSKCSFVSSKKDAFWDLQLAFPEGKDSDNFSIAQLLEYYCSPEKLVGDNKYHCQKCMSLQDAERSVSIETAPKNLIVVLKQFFYDAKRCLRAKLFHQVKLNKHINVSEGNATRKYELYAVIVHSGVNLDNGHYYTIARDTPQNWYILNDSDVQPCTEQTVYGLSGCSTPYIIFYKRLDACQPKGEGEFNPMEETIPFSLLPMFLVDQVKTAHYMHPYRRYARRKRSHSQYQGSTSKYSSSDEDQPGSSQTA